MAGAQNVAKTPWDAWSAQVKTASKQLAEQMRWAKQFANNCYIKIENVLFPERNIFSTQYIVLLFQFRSHSAISSKFPIKSINSLNKWLSL